MIGRTCVMTACMLFPLGVGSSAADPAVTNGDFSAGLAGWVIFGPVSDGGGFALLGEDPVVALATLEQQVVVPTGATGLSFDYGLSARPEGPSGFPFADGFAASLLDPVSADPILNTPGFTDFFFEDRTGFQDYDPAIVSVTGGRVTLDLAGVAAGTDALIVFLLLGGDDGYATQAMVDNVEVTARGTEVIPAPAAAPLAAIGVALIGYLRRRRRLLA